MNILWIVAHPDPNSLNGFLAAEGRRALEKEGHDVQVSDLYGMGWNPVVSAADYAHDPQARLHVAAAAKVAVERGVLAADIRAEQHKIDRADAIVIQFPMWWFGMPAILRGWFERVFVQGYAYGLTDAAGRPRVYGDGFLNGKRIQVVTTMGGPAWFYGDRGVHGAIDEILFPLQHGTLFYAGAQVLPALVFPGADRFTPDDAIAASATLVDRVLSLTEIDPIPFRPISDYDSDFVLRADLVPGEGGLSVHRV